MRSLTLALFDYLRKSHSRGFVLSISGGADSAAAACLVSLMVERALEELGPERFADAVGLAPEASARDWVAKLLCCAYQPTDNSGEVTRQAATAVADALGATFYILDVQHIVDAYEGLIGGAVGRSLTWDQDDITLQNIQARARGPSVWMLANMRGALLAVDEQPVGGGGRLRDDGRRHLRWPEPDRRHRQGLPASSGFAGSRPRARSACSQSRRSMRSTRRAPTAELRPKDSDQTDEGDLMPYPVLDVIERLAIGDKLPPADCLEVLTAEFSEYDQETLRAWVKRFFQLWARNQWKRERYAPSFHVDDKNLDPKTWCRFPILSGGFERELSEL